MCDKLPYCNPRIDDCMKEPIKRINKLPHTKTLACCCGHNIYEPTIVLKNSLGRIFELISGIELGPRKRNRYYKKDKKGIYFIPEVINYSLQ